MGGRDGDSVRYRSRVWHGSIVRARPALADVYAICRRPHRHAVLACGLRLLHRGGFPGDLSLRLEPGFSGVALAGWNCGCGERYSLCGFRRMGKLLDECAGWV